MDEWTGWWVNGRTNGDENHAPLWNEESHYRPT